MKDLVEYLAKALVDNPDPVHVEQTGTDDDVIFKLSVGREDLGKVIGKKGRTAKALRTLLSAAGAKHKTRVLLEIIEPQDDGEEEPAATANANGESPVAEVDSAV